MGEVFFLLMNEKHRLKTRSIKTKKKEIKLRTYK